MLLSLLLRTFVAAVWPQRRVSMYRRPRNPIEGYNALTKSPTDENLAEPARRRVRGLAFQTLLVAVLITATNIRKIGAFLAKTERSEGGLAHEQPNGSGSAEHGRCRPCAVRPAAWSDTGAGGRSRQTVHQERADQRADGGQQKDRERGLEAAAGVREPG